MLVVNKWATSGPLFAFHLCGHAFTNSYTASLLASMRFHCSKAWCMTTSIECTQATSSLIFLFTMSSFIKVVDTTYTYAFFCCCHFPLPPTINHVLFLLYPSHYDSLGGVSCQVSCISGHRVRKHWAHGLSSATKSPILSLPRLYLSWRMM